MRQYLGSRTGAIFIFLFAAVFMVVCLRAWCIPITHDEASTFFFYVQRNEWQPYVAHLYTNNHVLNSLLATQAYHFFGSHPFVLRLPNVLSFLFLAWGVWRFVSRHLKSLAGKSALIVFLILTFNLLDFFELSRGYGLSIAGMVLGLSFLQDYFTQKKFISLIWFSVCWQLALAANLTLVTAIAILLPLIWGFQILIRKAHRPANILLQGANVFLLVKWIRLALVYKEKGALDSGRAEDYLHTTFLSLTELVFGTRDGWMLFSLCLLLVGTLFTAVRFIQGNRGIAALFHPAVFYLLVFVLLVLAFYAQHVLFDVNYPDNRTALVFYVFFAVMVAFSFDRLSRTVSEPIAGVVALYSLAHFTAAMNLRTFTHYFYHVMPDAFYEKLLSEQSATNDPITIGGHMNREMNYAFINYRHGAKLNDMDVHATMHMNCDYYYARKYDAPYYSHYYDVLLTDDWDRVLLKRKEPIRRTPLSFGNRDTASWKGNVEFMDLVNTPLPEHLAGACLGADVVLSFVDVPVPFEAFVTLEVRAAGDRVMQYKRYVVNHSGDDLRGLKKRWRITSEAILPGAEKLVVYLWNMDSRPIHVRLESARLHRLRGPGLNDSIPVKYYFDMADEATRQL